MNAINGISYRIVDEDGIYFNGSYLLREDTITKQIIEYINDSTETILYDFSMQVGDTFWLPLTSNWNLDFILLDSITDKLVYFIMSFPGAPTITIKQTNPKIFYLSDSLFQTRFICIEGIGSVRGLCNPYEAHITDYITLICHFDATGYRDYHCNTDSSCTGPYSAISSTNERVNIYPDPVKDILIVQVENVDNIELYNIHGQIMYYGNERKINVSMLNPGIYIIRVYSNLGLIARKIIKQ